MKRTPPPGSIGFARISGIVGWFVWLGQLLSGDVSKWTHVWVTLDGGEILEGQPGGAVVGSLHQRYGAREVVYTDKPVADAVAAWSRSRVASGEFPTIRERIQYEEDLRARIVATARGYEHTPYGALQYVYIGIKRLGFRGDWLRKRIEDQKTHICSSLADAVMHDVGLTLFDDGRWYGEVSPGDLARYSGDTLIPVR